MMNRACTVVQRTCIKSTSSNPSKKVTTPTSRATPKRYCSSTASETTLAESAKENGGSPKFPSKTLMTHDQPTERVTNLVDEIMNLTFIEAAQLSSTLAKRMGVNPAMSALVGGYAPGPGAVAAAPVAAAPAPAAEAAKPAEPAKPSRVDVKLVKFADANKFKVLKEIRNLKPGMNLMESKSLIEGLPKVVMENLIYKDAEDWKKALTEAGAEVELV